MKCFGFSIISYILTALFMKYRKCVGMSKKMLKLSMNLFVPACLNIRVSDWVVKLRGWGTD